MPDTALRNVRLIIIGDEILSGRRQDKHFSKLIELLSQRGMRLRGAEIVPDDRPSIAHTLKRSFSGNDVVFCCGGIGGTPDDQTRQAAAEALGVPLALHPEAKRLIAERCADLAQKGQGSSDMSLPENQQRLQMGMFPQGAEIVPNPYNKIPGFFIRDHTFMPGFPVMAWPMMAWTLDTRYRHLQHQVAYTEHSFIVFGLPESRIAPVMEELERRWPGVKAFSLPSMSADGRSHIDLGVKGEPDAAAQALAFLREAAVSAGGTLNPPQK
ncbi:competence/damage-inducible protein A [Allopusillimonas soli]|uniref:Competence/damage-inducible protein A n=1 Tax=Allopusillimonas soli TaxID=659016 RepID=A0A853FG03_9BURK|nr:molybdopterin-binding protein [Allopusillimonas soli]NYT39013.1 competence/damage-inducible protein A [Allopusillimonas soli]TEA69547.1 competence/damage-inducible protein A [Allopusillimonas soli]